MSSDFRWWLLLVDGWWQVILERLWVVCLRPLVDNDIDAMNIQCWLSTVHQRTGPAIYITHPQRLISWCCQCMIRCKTCVIFSFSFLSRSDVFEMQCHQLLLLWCTTIPSCSLKRPPSGHGQLQESYISWSETWLWHDWLVSSFMDRLSVMVLLCILLKPRDRLLGLTHSSSEIKPVFYCEPHACICSHDLWHSVDAVSWHYEYVIYYLGVASSDGWRSLFLSSTQQEPRELEADTPVYTCTCYPWSSIRPGSYSNCIAFTTLSFNLLCRPIIMLSESRQDFWTLHRHHHHTE